jgi:hypothetical protein
MKKNWREGENAEKRRGGEVRWENGKNEKWKVKSKKMRSKKMKSKKMKCKKNEK